MTTSSSPPTEATAPAPAQWRPSRPIVLLLAAQLISIIGTQVTDLALPSLAVLRLHAGPGFTSALLTAAFLPAALAGPALGVLVDRSRPRIVMIAADLIRAATVLSIPVCAALGHLTLAAILIVAALVGVASAPADAAAFATTPRLVPSHLLNRANSAFASTAAVGRIGGPGIAGLLISAVGAATAMTVDAISYLVSAVLLAFVRIPGGRAAEPETEPRSVLNPALMDPAPVDPVSIDSPGVGRSPVDGPSASHLPAGRSPEVGASTSWRSELLAGLALLRADAVLARGIFGITLLNLGGSGIGGLITLYAYRRLGLTPAQLGLTMAVGSVLVLGGALAAPRIDRALGSGRALLAVASLAAGSLLLIPLASRGSGLLLLIVYEALFGFAAAAWSVLLNTMIQQRVPTGMLGRISSLSQSLGVAAVPIGTAIAAVVSETIGLVPALLIACACACAGPVLYSSRRFRSAAG